jgi:hypothetical protein
MTRQTFYRALKKAAPTFTWTFSREGLLRGRTKGKNDFIELYFCPMTAVYYTRTGKHIDTLGFPIAADYLGLTDKDRSTILCSADNFGSNNKKFCQKALLRAVGLTKKNP